MRRLQKSRHGFANATRPRGARYARRLNRALAVHLAGRCDEAHEILDYVGRFTSTMSPRLRALFGSVGAIFAHWDGADNYDEVYEALSRMRSAHFAGVAAAIEALPGRRERASVA